jgi:hypothetical protein
MQQLTIQFEGYADEQHLSTQGTAKQCQEDAATRVESLILSWIGSKAESLKTLAAATGMVAFGFTMMFLAAIIGG